MAMAGTAAATLVSNTTATLAATQSAANSGPVGDNDSAAITMQSKWKPYKIETKDIGFLEYYAVLQLGVGC